MMRFFGYLGSRKINPSASYFLRISGACTADPQNRHIDGAKLDVPVNNHFDLEKCRLLDLGWPIDFALFERTLVGVVGGMLLKLYGYVRCT